ncbi:MAG TPA: hypothetical protein VMU56_00330, partial [Beijerinckiaceae bacterium]|nr:hypothetical protein [Beijerinckiaceae bacterium]
RQNDDSLRAAFARIPAEPLPATLLLTQHSGSRADADEPIRAPIRQVRRVARIRREQRGRLLGLTALSFAAGAILALCAAALTENAPSLLAGPERYLFPREAARDAGMRLAGRAIDAYRTFGDDSRHAVEVSAPAEIVSWLSRQVRAPVRVPDLKAEGLRLLGGRLAPGDGGPAAFILFQTARGARVGLYIGRSPAQTRRFRYSESRMSGAVWWMIDGEGYAVVGPADRAWLTRIAQTAREQDLKPLR